MEEVVDYLVVGAGKLDLDLQQAYMLLPSIPY